MKDMELILGSELHRAMAKRFVGDADGFDAALCCVAKLLLKEDHGEEWIVGGFDAFELKDEIKRAGFRWGGYARSGKINFKRSIRILMSRGGQNPRRSIRILMSGGGQNPGKCKFPGNPQLF